MQILKEEIFEKTFFDKNKRKWYSVNLELVDIGEAILEIRVEISDNNVHWKRLGFYEIDFNTHIIFEKLKNELTKTESCAIARDLISSYSSHASRVVKK